jgi:hypothetical protein
MMIAAIDALARKAAMLLAVLAGAFAAFCWNRAVTSFTGEGETR